jgi:hypothetical protein
LYLQISDNIIEGFSQSSDIQPRRIVPICLEEERSSLLGVTAEADWIRRTTGINDELSKDNLPFQFS